MPRAGTSGFAIAIAALLLLGTATPSQAAVPAKKYASCKKLNAVYKGGVSDRRKPVDKGPVATAMIKPTFAPKAYRLNRRALNRDHDRIVCEKAALRTTPAPTPAPTPLDVPLGSSAKVGDDFVVTVTAVNFDADAIIAAANMFNDPSQGHYILVDLTATYVGTTEGDVGDLDSSFVGSDQRLYSDSDCSAVVPNESFEQPLLLNGGTTSWQVCMDVPVAAVAGNRLFVEPLFSWDSSDRVYFAAR